MPVFLPVKMPGYIDNHGYDPFARIKRLPCRPSSARVKRKVRICVPKPKDKEVKNEDEVKTKSKDDFNLDYLGISNMMRSITFKTNHKWRLKNPDSDIDRKTLERKRSKPLKAWGNVSPERDGECSEEEAERQVDYNVLRRSRSSSFIKYKYPKEYHHGLHNQQGVLEENIPQCMRHYPRYTNLPTKQDCSYDAQGSVTQLKVHSVKSGNLPHPCVANAKHRRPMSAPPSYNMSKANSLQRGAALPRKQPANTQNGAQRERNGVYHVSYVDRSQTSHTEIRSIIEETTYDTHSLPVTFDGETPRQVVMKGEDSEDEGGTPSAVVEHTVVSLEDVEDEEEEGSEQGRLSIEDRYGSPTPLSLTHSVHALDSDLDKVKEVLTDSAAESIPDDTEDRRRNKKLKKRASKKAESDAEEVESDY